MKRPGQVLRKYVGTPYRLGGNSFSTGLDCVSFIRRVYADLKHPLPAAHGGVTLETYPDLWRENRRRAKLTLARYLLSVGREIPACEAFIGDVLILDPKNEDHRKYGPAVGIHAGQANFVTAFEDTGVQVANIDLFYVTHAVRILGGA